MDKQVSEIVAEWLIKNRFDGLYNTNGECACGIEDLATCEEPSFECTAGMREECTEECGESHNFHIVGVETPPFWERQLNKLRYWRDEVIKEAFEEVFKYLKGRQS